MGWVASINRTIAASVVGRYFRLEFSGHVRERKGTSFLTEVNAGLATFFAMAYIISVNASIVSQSGGTCICTAANDTTCSNDASYLRCVQEIHQDLITATAAISAVSSIGMGLVANIPVSLAPGMGLNSWFTYQIVGFHGTGPLSYSSALTAVFFEGLAFLAITLLGLRKWLGRAIPSSLKVSAGAGIGLYIALVGLTYSGIGAITGGTNDPLQLGGCSPNYLDKTTGACKMDQMRNPTMWLGICCGGIFTALLMLYKVKGAIIFGIMLVSIISWPRGTSVTAFPHTDLGDLSFDFFKQGATFHPIKHVLAAQEWATPNTDRGKFALTLVTLLYVSILDVTGTLYSMAQFCGALDSEAQDFEGSTAAYLVSSVTISLGSLLGCPPVTAFVESSVGIAEGGSTGLTSCTTGLCFLVSIFFAPIFASIPPWATGCTLILVGGMMAKAVVHINWRYIGDAVPAFLTLAIMPFTYNIAYGLIAGLTTYVVINGIAYLLFLVSSGRIAPYNYEQADSWCARGDTDNRFLCGLTRFRRRKHRNLTGYIEDAPGVDGDVELDVQS
ncbi:MAG: hypothetical protein M1818_000257 [Claussenomyces sp. TS43310]|nr:MAG: hypothetical protein M1818_000257 [Claussenomyces sp. TS43310]